MIKLLRILAIICFACIIWGGYYYTVNAEFKFNFEDFFPKDDPELDFFQEFIKEFETDDNFYLISLENKSGIFDSVYFSKVQALAQDIKDQEHVKDAITLADLRYPVKTPFGVSSIPAIHTKDPSKYKQDSTILANDERFNKVLFTSDFKSSVISLKLSDGIDLKDSDQLVYAIDSLSKSYNFDEYYMLGRAYFQQGMIEMSTLEIKKSTIAASILVMLIIILIFRKPVPVILTMIALGLSMCGFMTYIGISGQKLSSLAGLYPILMIIVSTSDVIHMISKYMDELAKDHEPSVAIRKTLLDIGKATLLTSLTTSIGFATLLFSKLTPITEFGVNAAVGVILAYVIIIIFSATIFPLFNKEHFFRKHSKKTSIWSTMLEKIYHQTIHQKNRILIGCIIVVLFSLIGAFTITTNYTLVNNLPIGAKITNDYMYFEQNYAGFRPMEIAVKAGPGKTVDDYNVIQAIKKVEEYIKTFDNINQVNSYTSVFKSINRMLHGNQLSYYTLPDDQKEFNRLKRYLRNIPKSTTQILVNKDRTMTRISARVDDVGAETVSDKMDVIRDWITKEISPDIATFTITGTAMLLDKNTFHLRDSLFKGIASAIIIVSILMMLLFRNWKMLLISLVPNVLPLLFGAAIIGFAGIELEAGLSIIFAIAFGIAVDDTIHFLSKYKIEIDSGKTVEEAIHVTFQETGKAIMITTLILFCGFMVMLISIHPPSKSIGILISITLVAAVVADLYLIPGMIRLVYRTDPKKEEK